MPSLVEARGGTASSTPESPQAGAANPEARKIHGIVIGKLAGVDPLGIARVHLRADGSDSPRRATALVSLDPSDAGRSVAVMFEGGHAHKPIVLGRIETLEGAPAEPAVPVAKSAAIQGTIDGKRLVFHAEQEIILRCGEASITLTRAGKVLIRGAYLLSRSSGVNRIKGGSVQVN